MSAPTAVLRTVVLTVGLLLVGVAGLGVATDGFHAFTTETARRVAVHRNPPAVPATVPLVNQDGVHFTLADLQGKWVLVDFVYTRCMTICTVLGADFAQLERELAEPIAQDRIQLLSISFDLARDTPAELASYLTRFRGAGPGWQAAIPLTDDGLARLEDAFGITVIPDKMGGYTHNAAIHLVDPTGRLVDIFDLGQRDQVRAALQRELAS